MDDNPEEDFEEQVADNVEVQQEAIEYYSEDISPTFTRADDLYSLFWKTIKIKDSSKLANLDKQELGMLDISVRDLQRIADISEYLGYPEVATWLKDQAQIVLRTSASKKGWLTELFVTAKRFSSKEKKFGIPETLPQQQATPSFWNRFKKKQ